MESKYNHTKIEKEIYKIWQENNCFISRINPNKKPFCILMPPPNITGILHMGHALNNTIQDVLIRFKRMQGYEALWMPGTDHAGIATQNVVEKQLAKENLRKEDIGKEEFLKRLWAWREKYGSTILEQLKSLGASCDWSRVRFTMDKEYSDTVCEVFFRLYKDGLIYRGEYIVNWCPRCKTALSDEEAPRKEIDGWLYYIRYPIINKNTKKEDYIVVATTRPETMLGDVAVAINPKDKRYKNLKDFEIILPIINRKLRLVEDDSIDMEFGTGIVKVTPAHDLADFILAKKYNLEFINIMNEDGTLNENSKVFIGIDRFKAREKVLELLDSQNLIVKKEKHKINVGHCYRCDTLIEPRLSLQWFLRMQELAKPAIDVVEKDKIKFYPERFKKIYLNWMYNIKDWCISRQIWWGHRIPVYYCKNCKENNLNREIKLIDKDTLIDKDGIIVSKNKITKCPVCEGDVYQDEDVLDTWFSSWLWPFATFYWPFNTYKESAKKDLEYFYPTSVLVTAQEILFFWVARMIMSGLKFIGDIPFYNVLIHGTVRDEEGRKMSKSLGNIIDPLEIINEFGADSLRFSLMMLSGFGTDLYLSSENFLLGRNFCNKLWNATRLILLKVESLNLKFKDFEFSKLSFPDIWILEELNKTIENFTKDLENYNISEATKKIYDFFWHSFCDWYLEIIKDTFSFSSYNVAFFVLLNAIKLLHPIIPFITEEIFRIIKPYSDIKEDLIIKSSWPKKYPIKELDISKFKFLLDTIKIIRTVKADLGINTKKIILSVNPKENLDYWKENEKWIKRLALLDDILYKDSLSRIIYENDYWGIDFSLNLDVNISDSLDKKISNLKNLFENTKKRLSNQDFLKNASPAVIDKEKEKFKDLSIEINRLENLKNIFKNDIK